VVARLKFLLRLLLFLYNYLFSVPNIQALLFDPSFPVRAVGSSRGRQAGHQVCKK